MTPDPNRHVTYEFDTYPDDNTPRLRAVFSERMLQAAWDAET